MTSSKHQCCTSQNCNEVEKLETMLSHLCLEIENLTTNCLYFNEDIHEWWKERKTINLLKLKKSGLAKLTNEEKKALGLCDIT